MAKKVFTDYYMADEERLKGYIIANVCFGINAADSGMLIELEREIDNVVLGIDILYDPDHEELEEPCQISQEYVKKIYSISEEPEKKVCQWRCVLENNNDWPLNNGCKE